MKSKLLLLVLCTALASLTTKTAAQHLEHNDSIDTQYSIDKPSNQSYRGEELPWRNDLRIGVGVPGFIHLIVSAGIQVDVDPSSTIPTTSDSLAADRYYDTSSYYLPPFTLEYGHYLKSWFMIGCKAMYSSIYHHERHIATHKRFATHCDNTISLLFNMRFEYLRRDLFRMYSGIGVGATVRFSENFALGIPMFDMTYIGMTVGRSLYGFAEFGAGISGCIRVGMGYKF